MHCYACGGQAAGQCGSCGQPFCTEHGSLDPGPFCQECLGPQYAVPSGSVYKGSLVALLVAAGLAVWLLAFPPRLPQETGATETLPSQAEETFARDRTPPLLGPDASPTPSPAVTPTPTPTETPAPAPSPTPQPPPPPPTPALLEYVVQEGDTLLAIAERHLPPGKGLWDFAQEIAAVNGLDFNSPDIRPGDRIRVPQQ